MSKIKICGLFRKEDTEFVNEAKPDYCGFILHFPKSHRSLEPEKAKELRQYIDSSVRVVGVFVNQPPEYVIQTADTVGLQVIQLHGNEDDDYIRKVQSESKLPVWKAFRIRNREDLIRAAGCAADMVLLDNGYGTGEVFDWSVVTEFERPFILAGGLTAENIPDAIKSLNPEIVDLSSGVETDKRKDREKILRAVKAARM